MVESNNDEERLARIEQMLEAIQHETTGLWRANATAGGRPGALTSPGHKGECIASDEFGNRPRRDDDPSN